MGFELDFYKVNKAEKQQFISQQYGDLKDLLEDESLTEVIDFYCSDGVLFSDIIKASMSSKVSDDADIVKLELEDLHKISFMLLSYLVRVNIHKSEVSKSFTFGEDDDTLIVKDCDGVELLDEQEAIRRVYKTDDIEGCNSIAVVDSDSKFFNILDYMRTISKCVQQVNFDKEELYFVASW